jgi:hypothetical protein
VEAATALIDSDWWKRVRRNPSPLLVRQLAAMNATSADVRLTDLARAPSLEPRDLDFSRLDDPVAAPRLADAARPVRLGACERSGATIVVTFTANDLERVAAYGARALAAAGLERGMKVANTLEGGLETPGSLILGDALERLGALDVPLGPAREERAVKALAAMVDRVAADVLVLDGPTGAPLLVELRKHPPRSWRGTVWLGDDPPTGVPGWCRRWISVPEASVFFAVECRSGTLHADPELHLEEREGSLRLTSLAGDAPLFAYDPGLALRLVRATCPCGDSRSAVALRAPI